MVGPGTDQTGVEHSGVLTQAKGLAFGLVEERLGQLT